MRELFFVEHEPKSAFCRAVLDFHCPCVESAFEGFKHLAFIFGVGVAAKTFPFGLEYQNMRFARSATSHGYEIRPNAVLLPAPQIITVSLPRCYPMPPLQRLDFVQVAGEVPLQRGVELLGV